VFSCSDFIGGRKEFPGLRGRQELQSGRASCRPSGTEEPRLCDPRDGDSAGLVAAQHVEMPVVLADLETDVTTQPVFEDQHGSGGWLDLAPERK